MKIEQAHKINLKTNYLLTTSSYRNNQKSEGRYNIGLGIGTYLK